MPDNQQFLLGSVLRKALQLESNEVKATCLSFLFVFILMSAYFILRPIRDALASDWSDAEVSTLWTLTFIVSTVIVAVWGVAVSQLSFKRLVPGIYTFFAISFVVFSMCSQAMESRVFVYKTFYVWVSVFALFHTSVFWSFMADTYNKDQAGRLFAVISAGASLGAVVGPLIPGLFAGKVALENLMLIAAVMLTFPIPLIILLRRLKSTDLGNEGLSVDPSQYKIGGNPFKGFKDVITDRYLLGIAIFIILYTGIGSFVYLQQKNLLVDYTVEQRTTIYGFRDTILNACTYILALFVTGRVVKRMGMTTALPVVPLILIGCMLVLAFSPVMIIAISMYVVFRAGNYSVTRPAREMLFTEVSREDRFKTKPVIDIVAYRGGDVIMAWLFTGLTQGLQMGLGGVAAVGAGIAALWAFVGYLLGKKYERN
ncbi:MAG: NTP/NDP exchange transporter [Puniceicoccaceae bacterium]